MGQTPKPMRLYVTEKEMLEWDVFQELAAKGNLVKAVNLKPNTLVLGPGAHRLLKGMEKYVEVAIKAARVHYTPRVSISSISPKKNKKRSSGTASSQVREPRSSQKQATVEVKE